MKLVFSFIFLSLVTNASVWSVDRSWSEDAEAEYSSWVSNNWKNDIFTNPNSDLNGLETDCADATYTMRAYFAYLNRLPFSFHRYDGVKVDQSMTSFDTYRDPLQRFRAFLMYLYKSTSTHTLPLDTYPIPLSRKYMVAGTVYVSPGIHSYQIVGLDKYGIPLTLSSTVPIKKRVLFFNYGFPFYVPEKFDKMTDGYRSFRKINDDNISEQYQIAKNSNDDFIQFQKLMIEKLRVEPEPFERRISRIKGNLCFFSRERAVLVADAFVRHAARGNQCMGRAEFDDYSTYQRDKKLKSYFTEFKKMTTEKEWQTTALESKRSLLSAFLPEIEDSECQVETSLPFKPILKLSEIYQAIDQNKIVSDPNATMHQRWGFEAYKPLCPIY